MEAYDDDTVDDADVDGHRTRYNLHSHVEELCVAVEEGPLQLCECLVGFHVRHVHCSPSQVKVQHHPLHTSVLLGLSVGIPEFTGYAFHVPDEPGSNRSEDFKP